MTFFETFLRSIPKYKSTLLATILVCVFAVASSAGPSEQVPAGADPKLYLDDVKALTTPAMEGRGDGTKGLTLAARMLEKRYRELGLTAGGFEFLLSALQRDYGSETAIGA